jgi:hypothetical protein
MPIMYIPPTTTLLEAQDILTLANFRGAPAAERRDPPPARDLPHDFLVLSPRPDLTPELFERT